MGIFDKLKHNIKEKRDFNRSIKQDARAVEKEEYQKASVIEARRAARERAREKARNRYARPAPPKPIQATRAVAPRHTAAPRRSKPKGNTQRRKPTRRKPTRRRAAAPRAPAIKKKSFNYDIPSYSDTMK